MSEVLILFIDSLPAERVPEMRHLSEWDAWPLTPGFGYSINLHPELFAGLTPDAVGFFGEWSYDPEHAPGRRWRSVLPALAAVCRPYVLNRGLQTLITSRQHPGKRINIPLRHIDKFAIHGEPITSPQFPAQTLFTRHPQLVALSKAGRPKGQRDRSLLEEARHRIDAGHHQIFVPIPDLDGIGHTWGVDAPQYDDHLQHLDTWTADPTRRFLDRYPNGDVFVVSDHGMATIRGGVRLDIENHFGPPSEARYIYFTDSTLLRIWVFQPGLTGAIGEYLENLGQGRVVDADERQRYGLATPGFGDIIYVLDEGLAFEPSYFARHIPQAMHGYHPDSASQTALLLHRGSHRPDQPLERSLHAFAALDAALQA
jgi:hypothetical protein